MDDEGRRRLVGQSTLPHRLREQRTGRLSACQDIPVFLDQTLEIAARLGA